MNHTFDVDVAKEHGVHAAVLFENIRYWIAKNKANNAHFHDGRYWTYSSYTAFAELFPYLTERQIKYALQKLRDANLLIVGNYNSLPFDRTMWYALGDGCAHIGKCDSPNRPISTDENVQSQRTELSPLTGQNCPTNTIYNPDINTDVNTDIGEGHLPKPRRTGARTHTLRYGSYNNVKLSAEELAKLKAVYPRDWSARIDRLSEYIASKGNKYRSHYATIRSWARRDAEQASGAAKPAKVNPAQQYEQRKYDNDKMEQRLAVDFSELE